MVRNCLLCKTYFRGSDHSVHKFPKNPELRGKWLDVLGLKDDDISRNYAFLCSDHFSANDFVVCFSGGRFLKRDAVPSVSGRQQSDIECPNKYTSEDFTKAVVPDVEDDRKLGSNTFLIKVEKNETVDSPTLKVQSLSYESTITGSFSSTGIFTASEIQKLDESETTLSLQKNNKCEELDGCLGIKLEEFEIKKEEDEHDWNKNNILSLTDSSTIFSGDDEMKPFVDTPNIHEANHTAIKSSLCQNSSEIEMEYPNGLHVKLIEDAESTIYHCKLCTYKTKLKKYLSRHMSVHKDGPEVTTYQCKVCLYTTKRERDLHRHEVIHQDASEETTYQCELCPYKTNRESKLSKHITIHQDAFEVTYDCNLCPYKAKLKWMLTQHMLIHNDNPNVKIYHCELCPFKTKWRGNLTKHMLVHEDASKVTTYDCKLCSYRTKWKSNLLDHMLIHKDVSKVTTYQCKLCPHKTKRKSSLSRHELIHQDASRVNIYQCKYCQYETKRKETLSRHELTHQDSSDVTSYQCTLCQYKTKRKESLSRHVLVHQDASEAVTYHCEVCQYKTKWKSGLARHFLTHKDASEVTTYQCNFCPYKAKLKNYLKKHMLIHKDNSQDAKSAQEGMMEYQELEGCPPIKSEEVDIKEEEDECDDARDKF